MKNILLVSYAFIAALIGAGFASGQEILCYFSVFGKQGAFGIFIASLIFAFFIYTVLCTCISHNLHDFDSFTEIFKNKIIKKIISGCITVFSFAVYSAMLSAAGTSICLLFNIPVFFGSLLSALACGFLFCRGIKGLFDANGLLGLLLATGIIICCIYMLRYREYHVFSDTAASAANSCIYSGYNLITLVPMITIMSTRLKSHSEALAVSAITGAILLLIMLLMFILLATYSNKIALGEIPMLTLAQRQNSFFSYIYCLLLSGAIVTTLFSSGGAVIESLGVSHSPTRIFGISAAAWILSLLGFGRLVNTAYRLCGIIGIIGCAAIIILCKNKN